MIVLGIVLLVLGWVFGLAILTYLGVAALVIGLILWILGAVGRPVGGRTVWY